MNDLSIAVHYASDDADNSVMLELEMLGEPILFGIWDVSVRYRGRLLRPEGDWTETCVSKENDCDYLEIDLPLSENYRLQRFFLLDSADRVLVLGDTVLRDGESKRLRSGKEGFELLYESKLFYSPNLTPFPNDEATEIDFQTEKRNRPTSLFRVLPLALPEWKTDETPGSLTARDSTLLLRQRGKGRSLFAPLFFDLNPERLKKPYTWRPLTVGENMEPVADDQAVAFRIQLGKEQYLLYHSMTPPANRTVLGHNLIDDLCFARFDRHDGVEPLVEVQQDF